jgi:hypothetical protein
MALRQLLCELGANVPASVFVVQHLAPAPESHLADILRRTWTLPVSWAEHGLIAERGHVYVAPPRATPPGRRRAAPGGRRPARKPGPAVDQPAVPLGGGQLCAAHRRRAADRSPRRRHCRPRRRSLRWRRVHRPGSSEAEPAEMPRTAVEAGVADHVAPLAAIPTVIGPPSASRSTSCRRRASWSPTPPSIAPRSRARRRSMPSVPRPRPPVRSATARCGSSGRGGRAATAATLATPSPRSSSSPARRPRPNGRCGRPCVRCRSAQPRCGTWPAISARRAAISRRSSTSTMRPKRTPTRRAPVSSCSACAASPATAEGSRVEAGVVDQLAQRLEAGWPHLPLLISPRRHYARSAGPPVDAGRGRALVRAARAERAGRAVGAPGGRCRAQRPAPRRRHPRRAGARAARAGRARARVPVGPASAGARPRRGLTAPLVSLDVRSVGSRASSARTHFRVAG